jgi:hypothetical protein
VRVRRGGVSGEVGRVGEWMGGSYHLLLPGLPLHAHLPPVLPTTHAARVNTYGAESTRYDVHVHVRTRGDACAQSGVNAAAGADSARRRVDVR